jgi:hypothetical protein
MADITITVHDAHVSRIRDAIGSFQGFIDENGIRRPATVQEIREFIIQHLTRIVRNQEREAAKAAIVVDDVEVS